MSVSTRLWRLVDGTVTRSGPLPLVLLLFLSGLVTSPVAAVVGAKKEKVDAPRPNVVLFLMDDVGWQDVGWHEGSGMSTPTLDRLAHTGAVLDSYYVQPVCSPSRAALMQGRWPWRAGMGLQHFDTLSPGSMAAMNLTQPTIAEVLRGAGYRRHMVGKWHLGYHAWENTPTGRGFESHMGYYQGEMLYYNKTFSFTSVAPDYLPEWLIKDTTGLDWWRNRTAWRGTEKIYSKELYDAEAAEVLDNHPAGGPPLFLYFAHQCAHLPLDRPPTQWYEECQHIPDGQRRTYCAMMAALDDSLARVEAKLKEKGMWDNTLLIVSTDNGGLPGNIGGRPQSIGSNMPLRAGKATVFQGGVRGAAFVNGGILPNKVRGTVIDGPLMHATDWFATIANLAGVSDALPGNLDSVDLWPWLTGASRGTTRDALPLNINRHIQVYPDFGTQIALVDRDGWKLVINEIIGEAVNYDGWFPIPPAKPVPPPTNPTPGRWLFNIRDDPAEKTNLYQVNQTVVRRLEATLAEFEKDYQPHQDNFPHLASLPAFHGGVWAPFKPIFSQTRNSREV